MSAHDADPTITGPHDPEHHPGATLAFEPEYAAALTQRVLSTTGESVVVSSPLTGQPLAHVPQSSEADVAEAFRRARRAQAAWARTSVGERAEAALRLHDLVLDRQDEIIDLIVWESGKARKHAFDEPGHIALTARYYGRTAERAPRQRTAPGTHPRADPGRRQPRPQGRGRDHQSLELPLHDGALRRAAGAGRGQRRGHQARRPDHAVGAAGRAAPRGGRLPEGPVAGRRRAWPRHRRRDRGRGRLRLLHRLDSDRQGDRQGLRRAADRLLARAGRQEPDPGAARRRHREGRRGRGARLVLERRPALRVDGAAVRGRPGLRPVRGPVRGAHRGDDVGGDPRLGQRHGHPDLRAAARDGAGPRRRRGRQGCSGARRRPGPAGPGAVLLRADDPRGRHRPR